MALKFYYAPVAYKVGKTYTALPNQSSADFATCTRSSPATFINQNGLLEEAPNDMPRLDWSNGRYPRLLLEGSSSNRLLYSNDFTQWNKTATGTGVEPTVTPAFGISPDGTLNATKIELNLGNGGSSNVNRSLISISYTEDGSSKYTSSIWIKSLSGNKTIVFDNGSLTYGQADITNEWTRIQTAPSSNSSSVISKTLSLGLRGGEYDTGVNSCEFLVYEAQTEIGEYVTSNIFTNGSSQSRSADTGYVTGDISNTLTSNEYTFEFKFGKALHIVEGSIVSLYEDGTNNFISIAFVSGSIAVQFNVGSNVFYSNYSYDYSKGGVVKFQAKSGDCKSKINGVQMDAETNTFSMPNFNRISLDSSTSSGKDFKGLVEYVKVYDSVSDY